MTPIVEGEVPIHGTLPARATVERTTGSGLTCPAAPPPQVAELCNTHCTHGHSPNLSVQNPCVMRCQDLALRFAMRDRAIVPVVEDDRDFQHENAVTRCTAIPAFLAPPHSGSLTLLEPSPTRIAPAPYGLTHSTHNGPFLLRMERDCSAHSLAPTGQIRACARARGKGRYARQHRPTNDKRPHVAGAVTASVVAGAMRSSPCSARCGTRTAFDPRPA